jgi:hypothetical protein
MAPPAKPLNALFSSFPTTIFSVMSALAVEHKAVNLGQGFPDEEGPSSMKDIASSSMVEFHNQYPPMPGVPELRQAVAEHSQKYQGIPVDWATETLITVGATEGIASCLMGLLNPGDEVRLLVTRNIVQGSMYVQRGISCICLAVQGLTCGQHSCEHLGQTRTTHSAGAAVTRSMQGICLLRAPH